MSPAVEFRKPTPMTWHKPARERGEPLVLVGRAHVVELQWDRNQTDGRIEVSASLLGTRDKATGARRRLAFVASFGRAVRVTRLPDNQADLWVDYTCFPLANHAQADQVEQWLAALPADEVRS